MTAERIEFNDFRRRFKKEHGWPGIICARCGHFAKGGHFHHVVPLRRGDSVGAENLIPLCHNCHDAIEEVAQLRVTVEEFLAIPTTADILIANRNRSVHPKLPYYKVLALTRKIGREMEAVKYEEKRQEGWPEYDELWAAEKEVFPLLADVEW